MKRILTIQDISCLGKCSITVALPIISAMGVETTILPTAVLSTHTMFPDFTVKDLTDQLLPITEHWKSQNVKFDAIYTGYLGSAEEIEIAKKIFADFGGDDTLIFIDPVMADNGKLYPAFDLEYAKLNAGLCGEADIIVPIMTRLTSMSFFRSLLGLVPRRLSLQVLHLTMERPVFTDWTQLQVRPSLMKMIISMQASTEQEIFLPVYPLVL